MSAAFISHLQSQIEATKADGLSKKEQKSVLSRRNNKRILVLLTASTLLTFVPTTTLVLQTMKA